MMIEQSQEDYQYYTTYQDCLNAQIRRMSKVIYSLSDLQDLKICLQSSQVRKQHRGVIGLAKLVKNQTAQALQKYIEQSSIINLLKDFTLQQVHPFLRMQAIVILSYIGPDKYLSSFFALSFVSTVCSFLSSDYEEEKLLDVVHVLSKLKIVHGETGEKQAALEFINHYFVTLLKSSPIQNKRLVVYKLFLSYQKYSKYLWSEQVLRYSCESFSKNSQNFPQETYYNLQQLFTIALEDEIWTETAIKIVRETDQFLSNLMQRFKQSKFYSRYCDMLQLTYQISKLGSQLTIQIFNLGLMNIIQNTAYSGQLQTTKKLTYLYEITNKQTFSPVTRLIVNNKNLMNCLLKRFDKIQHENSKIFFNLLENFIKFVESSMVYESFLDVKLIEHLIKSLQHSPKAKRHVILSFIPDIIFFEKKAREKALKIGLQGQIGMGRSRQYCHMVRHLKMSNVWSKLMSSVDENIIDKVSLIELILKGEPQ